MEKYFLIECKKDENISDLLLKINLPCSGILTRLPRYYIYGFNNIENKIFPSNFTSLPDKLNRLISSAEAWYLPAIVLSKAETNRIFKINKNIHETKKDEFIKIFTDIIENHMNKQPLHPFFLAKAINDISIVEIYKGYYYWLLAYYPEENDTIRVINYYNFTPKAHYSDFDIDLEFLKSIFSRWENLF